MADYKYEYRADKNEREEIERIRAQYAPASERQQKTDRLKELNKRAKRPATIAALTAGICGALLFGLGMTLSIEWNQLLWGIVAGAGGIAFLALTLPLHSALTKRGKKKYGAEIIKLSDELLKGDE